uniref:Uncharacterized protein n=1 Tax=Curvibacter symbiont subsp. Hydra magnipapillata TaxID=667019 RepID=C9Y7K9_CURXX|nr:hypothetical protein Csp_A01100 [Curvibacter putative symbiont of Hydra magnipapillata]
MKFAAEPRQHLRWGSKTPDFKAWQHHKNTGAHTPSGLR